MEDSPLHASLIWKVRYIFYRHEDPHPQYMLVNVGVDAKRVYMRAHHMSEREFNSEIVRMEALPELYIDGRDALTLARVIVETMDCKVPSIIKDLYRDYQIITHSEFYAKLNVLLDHTEL